MPNHTDHSAREERAPAPAHRPSIDSPPSSGSADSPAGALIQERRYSIAGTDIGDPAGPAAFDELLQQFGANRLAAVEAIRIGFPAALLKDTASYFRVPVHRIRAVVRLPDSTAKGLARRGALMDAATSERLWRLADLLRTAAELFNDAAAAKKWLRTPNPGFNNEAPMDFLDTEPGAMAVRQALSAVAPRSSA